MTVRVAAPAKVNLYLGVGPLMPDGYHAVDTVLHALELHDDVRVSAAPGFALSCHPDVGVPMADNLACRAAHALGEAFGRPVNAEVVLSKRIPHGAGLGGGSSDAAAVITGLARMWGVGPTDDRCVAAAATIGADVPFFLYGGAALMTGGVTASSARCRRSRRRSCWFARLNPCRQPPRIARSTPRRCPRATPPP
jgi:4-diphosphocytidyl-2-C-methyl-D-erythritol kinase